jgi:subtilisin family serine protease
MKKTFLITIMISFISFALFAQTINKYCQDGRVYVKFKNTAVVTITSKKALADYSNCEIIQKIADKYAVTGFKRPFYQTKSTDLLNTYMLEFSDYTDIDNILAELKSDPNVEYAEHVPLFYTSYVPNDPYYGYTANLSANADWHLDKINAAAAWDITKGSPNVKVAVLDNAIWAQHPDLVNKIVNKIDLADNDTTTTPPTMDYANSHGTHTCGLVAAETDNNIGVASIGYKTSLIAVKIGRDSDGALVAGFEGITWAADNDADIISMSWGGPQNSITGQNVVNYAYNKGIVLVAAAGNDSSNTVMYPAAYDNVIAVAATNEGDDKAPFSQYGPEIDVCAPGGFATGGMGIYQILSTTYADAGYTGMGALFGITGKYDLMAGTSMACPITAGLCALMLSVDSTLTPSRLEYYLEASCDNINSLNTAYLGNIGAGRINAFKAVQMVQDSIKPLVADFTASSTALSVNGSTNFTDLSIGNPVSWAWQFPGATPSSSTLQNPLGITYPAAGSYDVILTVTDSASHTSTETKTHLVVVQASANSAWIVQASAFAGQYRGIMDICIVDPTTVWASAFDGSGSGASLQEFTRTIDGGSTWVADTITGVSGYGIGNITAVSSQQAWVTLYNASATGGGKIMTTSDGGTTWTQQPTATFTGSSAFPDVVYFFDANNGVCIGDPNGGYFEIYTTTDAGNNWVRVAQADIPANQSGEMGWTGIYDAVGDTVWFGTNKGRIYKSVDKGLHWTVVTVGTADCNKISMADAMNGLMEYRVVSTSTGAITSFNLKRTTDGGATWADVTPASGTLFKSDISAVPGRPGLYVSIGGQTQSGGHGSSYSIDYGANWHTLDTVQYTAVKFISPATGWAGGFNINSTQEGIYKWANPPLSIAENDIYTSATIYPVPSNDFVNVEFYSDAKENISIKVYDVTGQLILEKNDKKSSPVYKTVLDISSMPTGVYMAVIGAGDKVYTKKIVKQ